MTKKMRETNTEAAFYLISFSHIAQPARAAMLLKWSSVGLGWFWFVFFNALFLLIHSLWVVLICEQINLGISKLLKWALYYAKQEPDKNGISGAIPTSGSNQYKQNSP